MITTINVSFTDEEIAVIKEAKGDLSYRMWMVAVARQQLLLKSGENPHEYQF